MEMKKAKPIDDLELYDLLVAAFPEKFNDDGKVDLWDEVMDFADETYGDVAALCELLGRLMYMTMPMEASLSGQLRHAMGPMQIVNGKALMTAAVSRVAEEQPAA